MVLDSQPWAIDSAWQKMKFDHGDFILFLQPDALHDDQALQTARWRPPSEETLKMDVDGSYLPEVDIMGGGGGLLRDHAGSWVAGFMSKMCVVSPFLAETMALRDGLGARCE